ncbi:MAG: MSEP-CTERM sorting domain-containing protein [Flavobacteriales bacterium]|nr:MSEP-CTERM sorting domain-containing protein [Flavobacteriales bacterium]
MNFLRNPKWLWFTHTLPILFIGLFAYGEFCIIESLLEPESIRMWKIFGAALSAMLVGTFVLSLGLIFFKKKLSLWHAIPLFILHVAFQYGLLAYSRDLIPWSIPRWMVQGDLTLYVFSFIMPILIYCLLIVVQHFTSGEKNYKAWKNFTVAILIPLSWYLFAQLVMPLFRRNGLYDFGEHTAAIFIIAGTTFFLFFIIRALLILIRKKGEKWKKYALIWKIPIALLFPILGLLVNQDFFKQGFSSRNEGIFGDFSDPWFFILAILNGILVCLPQVQNKIYRLILFIGKSITLVFTFYFFIVFLPFLPLSVIAIIAIGVGFLMLAPIILFVLQTQSLVQDFKFLNDHFSKSLLRVLMILSFLVIPTTITLNYSHDRRTLHNALDYVYSPDYSKEYLIDESSLKKTLETVKGHKTRRVGSGISENVTPFLSRYYNHIVLDNLTLSKTKIANLEHVFFGKIMPQSFPDRLRNSDVDITNVTVDSKYDPANQYWTSWVNFEISNNTSTNNKEYATIFNIPEGCWISDYYLYVGENKEMGILAEKKTATFVFNQIRNYRQDPGIVKYLSGNKISFRVFPFVQNEVRKTGIQFTHKEILKLNIDKETILLGDTSRLLRTTPSFEIKDVATYVSKNDKLGLRKTKRTPYLHFILDVSQQEKSNSEALIERFLKKPGWNTEDARITYVNTYIKEEAFDSNNFRERAQALKSESRGFFLERAIENILVDQIQNPSNKRPIIVVASGKDFAVQRDFADLELGFPDFDLFYQLDSNGTAIGRSLYSKPNDLIYKPSFHTKDVRVWPKSSGGEVYLKDDNLPSVILTNMDGDIEESITSTDHFKNGLLLRSQHLEQMIHPEKADDNWVSMLKASFQNNILTPLTSFIVVENEAQKAFLKKKQEEVIKGKRTLDLSDDIQNMSEPSSWLYILIFVIFVFFYRIRMKRKISHEH